MGKNPASQFYWSDWRKDPGIRACTFETRGIWFEMLCLMWESEQQGFFILNGKPPDDLTASRMIGCTSEQYQSALTELKANNVMSRNCHACLSTQNCADFCDTSQNVTLRSRNCHGIIYNRRMVKEAKLKQQYRDRKRKQRSKGHANVTPLSQDVLDVSSSSSSLNNNNKENPISMSRLKPITKGYVDISHKWYKNDLGIFVCNQCQTEFTYWKNLQEHFKKEPHV